ncbi:MAG TPA: HNH endonuclease [Solirubrobacterales bacterium]|nr:HNH endonuclease [Solirubrobacterales bacterium]
MRDELILALDLYFQKGRNPGGEAAQQLSETLRAIPVESWRTDDPKFRSPQSVTYKLQNFVALDPSLATGGFSHGGKGDAEVWEEFSSDPERLHKVALSIRDNLGSLTASEAEESEESITEAPEGQVLTRMHRKRERSASLRKAKKETVQKATGRLACEACDMDFSERYGTRAKGFIECHHIVPLHTLKPGQRTRLEDLALLCSNCHRVLHLRKPWLSVDELKQLINTPA